jgi:ribonucleoside-diphosphate reductase alpha chain
MIPFGSLQSKFLNQQIFKRIRSVADEANQELAVMLGEPALMKGTGLRCSHVLAVAPNLSTSSILGVTGGIEPMFAAIYTQESAAGDMQRCPPLLFKLLKDRGLWTRSIIDSCIEREGSIQHLAQLTDEEKLVFRTAFEIPQIDLIRLADDRAKYIDQAQSVNLFFNALSTEEEISEVHKAAMKCKYLKSLYYVRGIDSDKSVIRHDQTCTSCEG